MLQPPRRIERDVGQQVDGCFKDIEGTVRPILVEAMLRLAALHIDAEHLALTVGAAKMGVPGLSIFIQPHEHTVVMQSVLVEQFLPHELRDHIPVNAPVGSQVGIEPPHIQTTQEVEIYFNFVGRFVPPAFGEVELTPEELEEIRKREERKDRLHQNYLKRKASGAQKRYEDKIKGRKKAEIEAKKAAIRAEDIAKEVFVPVSSLPQREPMKGVQTA